MKISKFVLIFLITFVFQLSTNAQNIAQTELKELESQTVAQTETGNTSLTEEKVKELLQKASSDPIQNPITDYNEFAFSHAKRVFWWTLISSILIFIVVHVVIGFGIYFSSKQFEKTVITEGEQLPQTSMKINKDGVEVSSSVIGLLTLLISLIFFYLYLDKIYPIERVDLISPSQSTTSQNK